MSAGVAIKTYNVIYELIDDIRDLMEGKLGAVEERTPLGEAEVRAVFGTGSKKVAGCMVTEGLLRKGCLVVVCPSSSPAQQSTRSPGSGSRWLKRAAVCMPGKTKHQHASASTELPVAE